MRLLREHTIEPTEIGFDVDAVIANLNQPMVDFMNKRLPNKIEIQDITKHKLEELFPEAYNDVMELIDMMVNDPIGLGIIPYEGCVDVLDEIVRKTGMVHIITARPANGAIRGWFKHYFGKLADKFQITEVGHDGSKVQAYRKAGIKYFVDDRVRNLKEFENIGGTPIAFTQPWNIGLHNYNTVQVWPDIQRLIR